MKVGAGLGGEGATSGGGGPIQRTEDRVLKQ